MELYWLADKRVRIYTFKIWNVFHTEDTGNSIFPAEALLTMGLILRF
jgi:hypothetical protein